MSETFTDVVDAIQTSELNTGSTATPWARYWSRMLDAMLWMALIGYLVGSLAPDLFLQLTVITGNNDALLGVLLLPLAIILDAVCLAAFGQTPGRAIAGIKVEPREGERPSFGAALSRNLQVYVKGLGLGIPIVSLFTLLHAHGRVSRGLEASWDEYVGTRVVALSSSLGRTFLTAAIYVMLLFGVTVWERESERALDFEMPRQTPLATPDPIEDQLRASAAEEKRTLPRRLDEITFLDDVKVEGRTVIYSHRITRRDASDAELLRFLQENVVPKGCSDKQMREAADSYDVVYRYSYTLPNSPSDIAVDVSRKSCSDISRG